MRETRPTAILFACSLNAVRSPMAAALLQLFLGQDVRVESAGVGLGTLDLQAAPDFLLVEAMAEIGIDLSAHAPHRLEDLKPGLFDLVVTLSPEAQHRAV